MSVLQNPLSGVFSSLKVRETDALDIWIERLAQQESGGRCNIKHLDVNNKYSYGVLQFQEETWKTQMQIFKLRPYAEPAELQNEIYDCALQKELTRKMIEKNPSSWGHWRNSVLNVTGLPPAT